MTFTYANILPAYANVSNEKLRERLAEFETRGKAIAARIAKGERGEACGSHISKGRWVTSYSLENHLNSLRSAWKQENAILRYRENGGK
jgi:hypothetical protein